MCNVTQLHNYNATGDFNILGKHALYTVSTQSLRDKG